MKSHKQTVLEALGQSDGELVIAKYLKRNPILVLRAFGEFGNHSNYLLEFHNFFFFQKSICDCFRSQ